MEFPTFRVGLAGAPGNQVSSRDAEAEPRVNIARQFADIGCSNLYLHPNASSVIDATKVVDFKWDTSCKLNTDKIDLYIYRTGGLLRKVFQGIPFADGHYSTRLNPVWWNSTESSSLNVNIVKSGSPAWQSTWEAGPTFKIDYHPKEFVVTTTSNGQVVTITADPAANTGDTEFQNVESTGSKGPSKAVIAVAVVIPIVAICILAAVAFYFYRIREKEKLKRWSQALSQASAMEWEKGALPGERGSHYRPSSSYSRSNGRPSTSYGRPSTGYGRPSTGYGRPSMSSVNRPASSVYMENLAGAGAGQRAAFPSSEDHTRSSVVMADGSTRQSRISFADQPRPRVSFNEYARPHVSSGLAPHHDQAAAVYASGSAIDDRDLTNVSPTQVDGPGAFAAADMRKASTGHTGAVDARGNNVYDDAQTARTATASVDELRDMEAVMRESDYDDNQASSAPNFAVMRRSGVESQYIPEDHVEAIDGIDPEQARSPTPNGPTVQYGPDQMLAVYAARGKVNASPVNTPGAPAVPPSAPAPAALAPSKIRRFLSRKDKNARDELAPPLPSATLDTPRAVASPSPEPVSMRSYVHLNQGTASASAIGSLPPPGPPRSASRQSENSRYEDAYDGQQ